MNKENVHTSNKFISKDQFKLLVRKYYFKFFTKDPYTFKQFLKENFNILDIKEFKLNENNYPRVYPLVLIWINLFNIADIAGKKIFHMAQDIKLSYNFNEIAQSRGGHYDSRIARVALLPYISINFSPMIFLLRSTSISLGLMEFLRKFLFKENVNYNDYMHLFVSSSIMGFPFYYYLNILYEKRFYPIKHGIKNRIGLLYLMNFNENFLKHFIYFNIFTFLNRRDTESYKKDNLYEEKHNQILYETLQSNDTLARMSVLYSNDNPIYSDDKSFPVMMTSLLTSLIYSPIETVVNFKLNPQFKFTLNDTSSTSFKLFIKNVNITFGLNFVKLLFINSVLILSMLKFEMNKQDS